MPVRCNGRKHESKFIFHLVYIEILRQETYSVLNFQLLIHIAQKYYYYIQEIEI